MQQQQASHREQADLESLQRECQQLQGRLRDAEATSQVLDLSHVLFPWCMHALELPGSTQASAWEAFDGKFAAHAPQTSAWTSINGQGSVTGIVHPSQFTWGPPSEYSLTLVPR